MTEFGAGPEDQAAPPHRPLHTIEHPPELDVSVEKRVEEAEDVISLVLAPIGAPLPGWSPGAHIDLILEPGLERQYSLCGDPETQDTWRIAVLREPNGRGGSAWVHDRITAGSTLRVRGPRNNFPLVEAPSYLFIAGGIGVTPILPMIASADRPGARWRLLYGGRRESSMAFVNDLTGGNDRDRVVLWPEDQHGLLPLDDFLATPEPGTAIYCCGPEPLIAAVEERCEVWPHGTLNVERFSPKPGALDGEDRAFEVILEQSGLTLRVEDDETIIQACERAGVDVASSCREGTCGTCETAVIEGVPDPRDSFLDADEQADNATMMICCSRSRTPSLRLDL